MSEGPGETPGSRWARPRRGWIVLVYAIAVFFVVAGRHRDSVATWGEPPALHREHYIIERAVMFEAKDAPRQALGEGTNKSTLFYATPQWLLRKGGVGALHAYLALLSLLSIAIGAWCAHRAGGLLVGLLFVTDRFGAALFPLDIFNYSTTAPAFFIGSAATAIVLVRASPLRRALALFAVTGLAAAYYFPTAIGPGCLGLALLVEHVAPRPSKRLDRLLLGALALVALAGLALTLTGWVTPLRLHGGGSILAPYVVCASPLLLAVTATAAALDPDRAAEIAAKPEAWFRPLVRASLLAAVFYFAFQRPFWIAQHHVEVQFVPIWVLAIALVARYARRTIERIALWLDAQPGRRERTALRLSALLLASTAWPLVSPRPAPQRTADMPVIPDDPSTCTELPEGRFVVPIDLWRPMRPDDFCWRAGGAERRTSRLDAYGRCALDPAPLAATRVDAICTHAALDRAVHPAHRPPR